MTPHRAEDIFGRLFWASLAIAFLVVFGLACVDSCEPAPIGATVTPGLDAEPVPEMGTVGQ